MRLAQRQVPMDRDLVLLITPQEESKPFLEAVRLTKGGHVLAASYLPQFFSAPEHREFIFLIDCSGSMRGSSIRLAKEAVAEALRQLTAGDAFDIVVFGSTVGSLLGAPRPADPLWLTKGQEAVAAVEANLGGTELLQALEFVLRRPTDTAEAALSSLSPTVILSMKPRSLTVSAKAVDPTRGFLWWA